MSVLVGAKTTAANGLCNDYGRMAGSAKKRMGGFDLSTLKEPYRIEGKRP
jgi:threonine synthase